MPDSRIPISSRQTQNRKWKAWENKRALVQFSHRSQKFFLFLSEADSVTVINFRFEKFLEVQVNLIILLCLIFAVYFIFLRLDYFVYKPTTAVVTKENFRCLHHLALVFEH